MKIRIKFKRLNDAATLPRYASSGAACFDLQATPGPDVVIEPGGAHIFGTGLAVEIPEAHVMLINSRSGHGFKSSVRLSNCQGVIDSDYRGEVMVRLHNDGANPFKVAGGDRIAQAMVLQLPAIEMIEVDQFSDTARGQGGFGSTGA